MKNLGGGQEGNPCPRLTDLVSIAKGVIIDQTVGLSNPLSL